MRMRFLRKKQDSNILKEELRYREKGENTHLRNELLNDQYGFCAYSEAFIRPIDLAEIDHFDPGKKNTDEDSYHNWYAVLPKFNRTKPIKLDKYLPILDPNSDEINDRIEYDDGYYFPVNEEDTEAENLIKFLGLNKYELAEERQNHISRIKQIREFCESDEEFIKILSKDKFQLSFITALENELSIELFDLLEY